MSCFENNVFDWVRSNGLFDGASRVLLAVSGGADSVAMAHALVALKQQGRISCEFVIGHVNHQLRGEQSDADEHFVTALAHAHAIPMVATSVDVKGYAASTKLSIETAARTLRLKALAAIAQSHDCDAIATGHHKDDQAETLVHRLMRGTGFRGLCGIRPVSQVNGMTFIRPLLNVRRSEIIQYCEQNSLIWREDASNRNLNFTRNRIRHVLLPGLKNSVGTAHPTGDRVELLATLSHKSRQFLHKTEMHAQSILNNGHFEEINGLFTLKQDMLRQCPPWVFYECVRHMLVTLDVGLRQYTQPHFEAIRDLVGRPQGKADFPGPLEIGVENGFVFFKKKTAPAAPPQEAVALEPGQTLAFGSWRISCSTFQRRERDVEHFFATKDAFVEWFDADHIRGPVIIRPRQDGDRFWPIGGSGEKKVARFLQDAQLDPTTKHNTLIVADAETVLWVAPIRMSERTKITSGTRSIIEIQIRRC